MDPTEIEAIFSFADKLLGLIPVAVKAGGDVVSIIENGRSTLSAMQSQQRGPTDAEWSSLNATIDGYMNQLKTS